MFDYDWKSTARWRGEPTPAEHWQTALARGRVDRTMTLHWEVHCFECAHPTCYQSCALYVPRGDNCCERSHYGVHPAPQFTGLFERGADLRFRPWGKLETRVTGRYLSPRLQIALDHGNERVGRTTERAARHAGRWLRRAVDRGRHAGLDRSVSRAGIDDFDEFVIECHSPDPVPFRLLLELSDERSIVMRHAFEVVPGHNFHALPASSFPKVGAPRSARLAVFPEHDAQRRLIFTWLDFVRYRANATSPAVAGAKALSAALPAHADKLKCVVWDLDGTVWEEILTEAESADPTLRPGVREVIEELDRRGILQSVVSKNDHDEAWHALKRLGLDEYFLYPAINWGQKSANLRQIARELNIHLDALALIDDSAFERAEVAQALPMVRTYPETAVSGLLARPEVDVPITVMSTRRRQAYAIEGRRKGARARFTGDYAEFLRSCAIRARVFEPRDAEDVRRCWELVQRSNQLNLSTRRYSEDEFDRLRDRSGWRCIAIRCDDRFGEYGIVGFCSVDETGEQPIVRDFVLSCRVAKKQVEQSFFRWLALRARDDGHEALGAELTPSDRNGELAQALQELGFHPAPEGDGAVPLTLPLRRVQLPDYAVEVLAE